MKCIEISEEFFYEVVLKKIKEKYDIKISAGLIGYGSECYFYDDNISKDHDYSIMPCIWLENDDYIKYHEELEKEFYDMTYKSYKVMNAGEWAQGRRGILNIDDFIYSFLGSINGPSDEIEFRNIPEYLLSSFTNGKIFLDETGKITKIREKVKYYPEDIRLNRIATRCMQANREGTYNYERCIKRKEIVAANQALSKFIESAIELYFLINKKYCPYYKWQHKMLKEFDEKAYDLFNKLVDRNNTYNENINLIDVISSDIIDKLENAEIIIRMADYLSYYGNIIQSRIENEKIRNLGCWRD